MVDKHVRDAMFENMEEELISIIADFLESENTKAVEAIGGFRDPEIPNVSELHIRMAQAAMYEYVKTVERSK